jgi:hypothetical protein
MATTLTRARGWLAAIGLGAALWGLLAVNAACRRADWDLANLNLSRRYWEDLAVATVNYQRGTGFLYRGAAWDWWSAHIVAKLKAQLPETARQAQLRGWEFWRTVPCRYFSNAEPMRLRDSDDPGRTWLTVWGFHLLGGVAPYLPLWLGVLTALPLFVWLSVECRAAGCTWVACVTLACFALSAYAAELLTLPYSAAGFHLLGLLLVITLAVYALLHPRPTWWGLVGRWLLAGALLAICILCRGTCRSFVPALSLIAIAAAVRTTGGAAHGLWRVAGGTALALVLLLGPYLIIRPAQQHEIWVGMWEGLGDFDREKGHAWYDPTAREALRRAGATIPQPIQPEWGPELEQTMKRLMLRDIASDPWWYAKILAQRVPATLLQTRLWPRASVDGTSYRTSTHPNQGISNAYYSFARTADWFGLGPWTWEVPLPLFWLAPLLTVGLAAAERVMHRDVSAFPGLRLAALGLVAIAAGAMPVLFTTASGPETQAFVLVYFLAAGVMADGIRRAVRDARAFVRDAAQKN